MIAHHFSGRSLLIEIAIVVGLVLLFTAIAVHERRRRGRRRGPGARMRDV